MDIAVIILIVLACSTLVFLVIIQNSKGGGLASNFTVVSSASQIMGTMQTADTVVKLTWWLAGTVVALSFILNIIFSNPADNSADKGKLRMQNEISKQAVKPPNQAPTNPTQ